MSIKVENFSRYSIVLVGYFAKSVPLRNFILLNISYLFDVSSTEIVTFLNTSLFNYKYFKVIIRRTIVTIGEDCFIPASSLNC